MKFTEITESVLGEVMELVKGSKSFVLAHAPDLAKEIVKLGMVEGMAWIMLGIVIETFTFIGNRAISAFGLMGQIMSVCPIFACPGIHGYLSVAVLSQFSVERLMLSIQS